MHVEWTTLLLQGFAGGITGYVTNNYALNMLFREYTPLKLGGVIKKTKTEFIAAISELVERDLLSPAHLKNEFLKEEALEEWNILFASLWDEFFQAEFQQTPLEEIPGIQKSMEQWIDALVNKSLEPIQQGNLALPNLTVSDLLSEESFSFLARRIIMQSSAEIQQGSMIDSFLVDLLQPLEGKLLSEFLNDQEINDLENAVQQVIDQNLNLWKQHPEEISQALNRFVASKELEETITRWETTWGRQPLHELLTNTQIDEFKKAFQRSLLQLAKQDVLASFANDLSALLAKTALLDRPVLSLFDEKSQLSIQSWIKAIYQDGFDHLSDFLEERENVLKFRVKQAAQAELSAQSGMLGGMIQAPLFQAVDQLDLISALSGYRQKGEEGLLEILKTKSLNELGISINEKQLLALSHSFIDHAIEHWESAFEALISRSPLHIMGENWVQRLQQGSENISAENLVSLLFSWLDNRERLNSPLHSLGKIQWSRTSSENLLACLKGLNLQPVQNALLDQVGKMYDSFQNRSLPQDWMVSMLSREDVINGITSQINGITQAEMNQPIHGLLSKFNQTDSRNAFGENLISLIEKHGEEFLDGQVAGLVKTNLDQRDEEEIVDLAHDFIGRELQPITKFGFLLGLVAGVLLALFPLPKTLMVGPVDLFPIGVFAAVGVLTNWIALQMIFRPYKEIRWLKRIPFFRHFAQGYLLKNQRVFAENLAKFVDESLLNRNMIQQLFSDQKKNLKQRWIKWIPDKLPIWSKVAVKKKQKDLAKGLSDQVQRAFRDHSDDWSQTISASLGSALVSIDDPRLQSWLEDKGSALIRQNIQKWLDENQSNTLDKWFNHENLASLLVPILKQQDWTISEETASRLAENAISQFLLHNTLPKEGNAIESALGGALGSIIRTNQEMLIHRLLKAAEKEIQTRESQLADVINSRIQASLNFLQRSGFVLMGGPALIERILHRIINEELPDFLESESQALSEFCNPVINTLLSYKPEESWRFEHQAKSKIQQSLKDSLKSLCQHGNLTAKQLPISMKAANQWIKELHQEESWIDQQVAVSISPLAGPALQALKLESLLAMLPTHSLAAIKETLQSASTYSEVQKKGWQNIAATLARNTVLGDWIPVSLLSPQIKLLLSQIGKEEAYRELIAGMAESALPQVFDQIMSTDLVVEWMAENSFDPLYQATHAQLPALLSTLSFQDHIIREVDELAPQEIHRIFLSFAGTYFFRLEVYGLFGAVFGLHPVLPGIALVSEGWNAMKLKRRRKS